MWILLTSKCLDRKPSLQVTARTTSMTERDRARKDFSLRMLVAIALTLMMGILLHHQTDAWLALNPVEKVRTDNTSSTRSRVAWSSDQRCSRSRDRGRKRRAGVSGTD